MKIGVLTSSRADFGIYLPLLLKIEPDNFFDLTIIAFGTHGSPFHGETVSEIKDHGFKKIDLIHSLLLNDDEDSISTSYGLTVIKFSEYWANHHFDLVLCLGDRFEMSAAVQSGIPFGVKFAHLHGGETSLGAIDNIYRHQISLASSIHFTSTDVYKSKVESLIGTSEGVHNVGALSLNGIEEFDFKDEDQFRNEYSIPDEPYVISTFHPETVNPKKNEVYAVQLTNALKKVSDEFFIVLTLPNADTNGRLFRKAIKDLEAEIPDRILTIENFGKRNYFNAMKYATFMIGNSSSGILEAASFGLYVVNVGDRQKGRARGENVYDSSFNEKEILKTVEKVKKLGNYKGSNIYKKSNTANQIIKILKASNETL